MFESTKPQVIRLPKSGAPSEQAFCGCKKTAAVKAVRQAARVQTERPVSGLPGCLISLMLKTLLS